MEQDFTKGSVLKALIRFSIPYLISCFLQTFYGLVDLYVTGQFNKAASISAVSIGSQVMHMVTVIIVGLAMGSTVTISQAIGARKKDRAEKAVGNTVGLFLLVSLITTVILLGLTDSIIRILSTPTEAVSQTKLYLTICFLGIPFITAYNIISCVFRGLGDSKSPLYFVAAACVINIGLDFLFIGYFKMGAAGAALGTVLSQSASVIFAFLVIRKRELGLTVKRSDFIPDGQTLKNILKIGFPISLQDGFVQISFMLITIIANRRGVIAAASVGIVEKLISFFFLVPSAMLSSISSIAAQNVGAQKHDRAQKTLQYGITIAVSFGLIVAVLCQFFCKPLLGLFSSETAVILMGCQYLRSYIFDCPAAGIHFCFSGYFCAYGKSTISFLQNFISIILIRIPGAYLASALFPDTLFPMGIAAPAGSLLSALICIIAYVIMRSKSFSKAN
ncbi:MAG: MATE family efflux transporter [Lachnospiraceae bacterium]|nr:MATE family efflux transporter [Lachnospiraceae bacterium]